LYRELYRRGWLKTGGDDSVRMLMTVHDEIVFEMLEERVAEALPIIIRIMESPTKLIPKWRIPLVVEADLGSSWAANISWSKVLKGKQPRPPYLEGKNIIRDPEILIFAKGSELASVNSTSAVAAAVAPVTVVGPSPVALVAPAASIAQAPTQPVVETRPSIPPPKREADPVNGTKSFKVASFRLKTTFIDRDTVCSIVHACNDARMDAIKANKLHEQVVVEFVTGIDGNTLLYSAKEGYYVHAPGLETYLRRFNLFDAYVIREENHG
jgi:hypothetical protein